MPKHSAVTVYVDAAKLKRQAEAWAKKLQREAGVGISQPMSAYVRHLVDQDAKRKGGR